MLMLLPTTVDPYLPGGTDDTSLLPVKTTTPTALSH
jgi:hypothetical protein